MFPSSAEEENTRNEQTATAKSRITEMATVSRIFTLFLIYSLLLSYPLHRNFKGVAKAFPFSSTISKRR